MSTPGNGDNPPDAPGPRRGADIVRPLPPTDPQAESRRQRVIRPLAPEASTESNVLAPAGPTVTGAVIRRLESPSVARPLQAGSIIRPLVPLPPGMPGSRDRKTGIIRPLPALPPLPGSSPEERQDRRIQRDRRLAAILRPLEALPAPLAPYLDSDDVILPAAVLEAPVEGLMAEQVYCRRCESLNLAEQMFCRTCGGALPAAVSLYDTLTREYEDMQSAERPKAELIPHLPDGRRGPNWQAYGLSNKGLVRDNNEDTLVADPVPGNGWMLVVADGMGGAEAGEVASTQTAAIIRELIANRMSMDPSPDTDHRPWLMQAIEQANILLHIRSEEDPQLHGMGTTVTAGIVQGLCLELGHVGDSRCYRLAAGRPLEQLTTDHAIVSHLLRLGQITPDEAQHHPLRNQLYRVVATASTVEVDANLHVLAPTDRLLFCSDGLTLHVTDAEIESILRRATTPQEACRSLVDLTLKRGAGDNVSVIVLMAG
ncbi:MAG TPA: PP2C family serine/threonine-protein phosphatase [Chloroflexia bacterium]|nr:PP2C family serine/threonine-protein phosphatase [Chloroflexia bacterium]